MRIDAEQLGNGSLVESDVLVIGGGVAGLALARQLADAGRDVTILESGGEEPDKRVQALYDGRMSLGGAGCPTREIDDYLVTSRVRCLGGSGNVWGGKCGPLDPMDFEKRAWVPHSGWPLTRREMQPWYDRACALLGMRRFDAANGGIDGIPDGVFGGHSTLFTPRPRCYTNVTGLSASGKYDEYKRAAADHPRVRTYLHANVTHIGLHRDGTAVDSLRIRCLDGRTHEARARTYVLATGGIENVRLLLVSNDVHRDGIGNHSGWLGRGFAGHTTISQDAAPALWLLRAAAELVPYDNSDRTRPHVVLGASDQAQRRFEGINFTATLTAPPEETAPATEIVGSLVSRVMRAPAHTRQGAFFMLEQTPNRDSRITLTDERDELDMPRVRLDLRYNELDLDWLERIVTLLANELGAREAGRLQWSVRRDELISLMSLSRHHMGATRMSVSPRDGVVDADCRVHGVRNLYVAGSSVFPTSGIVNPTLTLLALVFRLGEHLRTVGSA